MFIQRIAAAAALVVCCCVATATAQEYDDLGEPSVAATVYQPTAYWYSGAEFLFLNVNADSGGQITVSFSDTTAPGVATTAFRDGEGVADYAAAPRFWLGRQLNENWGLRGSYFSASASESRTPHLNPAIPTTGTNFGTYTAWGNAQLTAVDLDVVRSFYMSDDWKLDAFAGARYGSFDVSSGIDSFGVFTTGNFVNLNLQNNCQFDGAGASLGFSSRNRLWGSNLYLLWSGRGSMLFGRSDMVARSAGTVASSPSAPLVGAANDDLDRNVPSTLDIIESQLGLQYEFRLLEMPYNCFVRCAFEFQHWNVNNQENRGAGFGGTIGELTTNSFASGGPGNATLLGLSLATGFTW
ncbi:Lpg1974 family pore-forming outer membrane protein [Anatilimnocola floriformis]|uniref:Lpg1974 family pore-forming outer membrane protein n=1 Tax=Anatilimnocola floriformis TaxID=2948575 RepID=UPI0020C41B4F|nr:Lpg1974 family pore-forming outer membrane protein [Anatilimnocola floriformis]